MSSARKLGRNTLFGAVENALMTTFSRRRGDIVSRATAAVASPARASSGLSLAAIIAELPRHAVTRINFMLNYAWHASASNHRCP